MKPLELDKNNKYLLACSFGPDSMALFTMLLEQEFNFEVAIVNYHLRKESDNEVEGLQKFCNEHDKKLHILDVKEKINTNIEEICREIRYNFFSAICIKNDLGGVIVAHHEDDLIETYLMQKSRQILPIWYGLQKETTIMGNKVYRPLLCYSKFQLIDYCKKQNTPYMIDKSNLSDIYLRNRIRHLIVEKMDLVERKTVIKEIQNANKDLIKLFESLEINKISNVDYLLSLKGKSFNYCINLLISQSYANVGIGDKQCREIKKVLLSRKPNIQFNVNKSVVLLKEYKTIKVVSDVKSNYSYRIDAPKVVDTPYFYIDLLHFDKVMIKESDYPLLIRNIDEKDTYIIKDYIVSARRLMIDWKVPASLRKIWPVIVNNNNKVIFIPRYQKDFIPDSSSSFYVKTK